jgi:hypothetical protein
MPSTPGTYPVLLYIYSGGQGIGLYRAAEDVVILVVLIAATEILRPNGAGDETSIYSQYPGSGAHWDKVDDVTPDEDATHLYSPTGSYCRDLYSLPESAVPVASQGSINSVTVYVRAKAAPSVPTVGTLKIVCKTGGTIYESSEVTPGLAYTNFSAAWACNPKTGLAWTWSEINTLQIGVAIRQDSYGNFNRVTQVWVEINYLNVTITETITPWTISALSNTVSQSDLPGTSAWLMFKTEATITNSGNVSVTKTITQYKRWPGLANIVILKQISIALAPGQSFSYVAPVNDTEKNYYLLAHNEPVETWLESNTGDTSPIATVWGP